MDSTKETMTHQTAYLLAILLVSLLLRIWGISYEMPYPFILDETYMVNRSLSLGAGDLNPHLFEWPGHLLMYSLLAIYGTYFVFGYITGVFSSTEDFAIAFISDPTNFYLIARTFMVILSTAAVYATYRVGSEAYDRKTGLIAALFLAVSPLVSGISHFVLSDIPVLLASVLVFIPVIRIARQGRTGDYIWAGIIVGAGIAVKYNTGALALPLLTAHILYALKQNTPLRFLVLHRGLLFAGCAMVTAFFAGCPYCLLDYQTFMRDVMFQFSRVSSLGMINAEYASPFLYYMKEALGGGVGVLITISCIAGMALALYRRKEPDIVFLAFIAAYLIYISSWKVAIDKYILPVIPVILITGAALLSKLFDRLPFQERQKAFIIVPLLILFTAGPLMKSVKVNYTLTRKDTRVIAKEWIEANIAEGTGIAIDSGRLDVAKLSPPLNDTPENLYKILVTSGMDGTNKYSESVGEVSETYFRLLTKARSGKQYPLTRIVLSAEGSVDRSLSIEGLKNNNVEYVVVSSFAYKGYESPAYRLNNPEAAEFYTRFYGGLDQECILINEIRSDPDTRQGPTIKIYRIPDSADEWVPVRSGYNEL